MAKEVGSIRGKDASPYETFDSGAGPTIPKGEESSFDNKDSELSEQGVSTGQVPTVPQK